MAESRTRAADPTGIARWWVYQKERFPVFGHGPLIAAFSFSAVSCSWLLRGQSGFPPFNAALVAFVTAFLFFLQLRIADEFKDFQEDSRFRPYRPVPRGLVTLRELGVLWVITGVFQLGLSLWLHPPLAILLLVVWIYLALMTREFFVRDWLKARPITYMWTHMIIMPLIDFFATSSDWLVSVGRPPAGLIWFLVASFFNGLVVEIGRKLRAPQDEEHGVETYSALWGRRNASLAWIGMMAATAVCACLAAKRLDFLLPVGAILGTLLFVAVLLVWKFLQQETKGAGRRIEAMSGIWTILMYLNIGPIPLLVRWLNR
jgi:4-hydroxybenzoate polyprenyltransferase